MGDATEPILVNAGKKAKPIKNLGTNTLLTLIVVLLVVISIIMVLSFIDDQNVEIQVIDCRNVNRFSGSAWNVVAAYSYQTGSDYIGYTVYTKCVLER